MEKKRKQNNVLEGMSPGILFIDKPSGITSFDVIRILRKKLGIKKMGHAGTLDPMASGLLIVAVGKETKKLNNFLKLSKEYVAEILLGKRTDTGDVTGKIIEEKEIPKFDEKILNSALMDIKGDNYLPVPVFSAIKVKGKALYKYARISKKIELPVKKMTVKDFKILNFGQKILKIHFFVESGVYIRSLAEKIGDSLGTCATLMELRRIKIGEYSIVNSTRLEI